jgi:hypothetical protein
METSLTFLYTGGLSGNLDVLPRLYTYLRSLRARVSEGRVLYVDIGAACVSDVWHCAVTGGRSMVIMLDGMGCAAANVNGYFSADGRVRLGANLAITLIDDAHEHVIDDLIITTQPTVHGGLGVLTVVLTPAESTHLRDQTLHFGAIRGGQIGMASAEKVEQVWGLTSYAVHDLPADTLPDPTIMGAVEFVLSEARQAQKRQTNT